MKNDALDIFQDIVASCRKRQKLSENSYNIQCPCHDDRTASLTITYADSTALRGEKTVLVKCHAGCTNESVISHFKSHGMWFTKDGNKNPKPKPKPKPKPEPKEKPVEAFSIIPAPEAPPDPIIGAHGASPVRLWEYVTQDGALAFIVARFQNRNGTKSIRPYSFVRAGDAGGTWAWRLRLGDGELYPLYNAPQAHTDAHKPLLVVEGEKACDAAKENPAFKDYVCVTYVGGAGNYRKSDWSVARGRKVVLLPDNDAPGLKQFKGLAAHLQVIDADVHMAFMKQIDGLPKGWDVADEWYEGFDIAKMVDEAKLVDVEDIEPEKIIGPCPNRAKAIKELSERFVALLTPAGNVTFVDLLSKAKGYDASLPYAQLSNKTNLQIYHPTKFYDTSTAKMVREVDALLDSPELRMANGVVYDPTTTDVIVTDNGIQKININCGFAVEPERGDLPKVFFDHLEASMGREAATWLLDWIAHLIQTPKEKPGTAVILRGHQGSGKTVIGNIICAMIGRRHAYKGSFQANFLRDTYNGQASGKLFMQLDEMELGLSNRRNIEAAIKVATTDTTIQINEKYGGSRLEDSYHRYLFTSNAQMPIPVYVDDRRLSVFDVKKALIHEDPEFWTKMWDITTNPKALSALLYFFLTRKITTNVKRPPNTDAREDMVSQSDPFLEFFEEWFHGDQVPRELERTIEGSGRDDEWEQRSVMVSKSRLYDHYEHWIKRKGKERDTRTRHALFAMVKAIFGEQDNRSMRFVAYDRVRGIYTGTSMPAKILEVPKRSVCRENFEKLIGREIRWADLDAEVVDDDEVVVPFNGQAGDELGLH